MNFVTWMRKESYKMRQRSNLSHCPHLVLSNFILLFCYILASSGTHLIVISSSAKDKHIFLHQFFLFLIWFIVDIWSSGTLPKGCSNNYQLLS